jgi:hypothetical protein
MGILFNNANFLVNAKRNNVQFGKILTIGHLSLFLSQKQLQMLAERYKPDAMGAIQPGKQYADKFFELFLDSKIVMSLDYSDYEDCNIVHDMNYSIDSRHYEEFDAVIDGGSLEHIFNFPVAIANCMNMVRKDGSLFLFTMTNNHAGHGFYQFSPELFFRMFQPENGFEIKELILETHPYPGAELSSRSKCYSVIDPAILHCRVGLVSKSPVTMMIHAVRTELKPIFSNFPIQSDYQSTYESVLPKEFDRRPSSMQPSFTKIFGKKLLGLLPTSFSNFLIGNRQLWHYSFSNKRFYKRWRPF